MSTAASNLAMLERRLDYLAQPHQARNEMAKREADALRWVMPMARAAAAREAKRPHLGAACLACGTAAGFLCAHLPRRT